MKRSIIVTAFFLAALSVPAVGSSSSELTSALAAQVGTLDQAVGSAAAPSAGQGEQWLLKNFWLRIRVPVGLKFFGAKVTVIPETELLWQRDNPDGWAPYKP